MPRILVVDDEKDVRLLLRDMLLSEGHKTVDIAGSADEALRWFESAEAVPDLTLMDQRMPGKSGLEAIREILALRPEARILVISADATIRDRWQEAGATGFIEKPVDWKQLRRAIEQALPGAPVSVDADEDTG